MLCLVEVRFLWVPSAFLARATRCWRILVKLVNRHSEVINLFATQIRNFSHIHFIQHLSNTKTKPKQPHRLTTVVASAKWWTHRISCNMVKPASSAGNASEPVAKSQSRRQARETHQNQWQNRKAGVKRGKRIRTSGKIVKQASSAGNVSEPVAKSWSRRQARETHQNQWQNREPGVKRRKTPATHRWHLTIWHSKEKTGKISLVGLCDA